MEIITNDINSCFIYRKKKNQNDSRWQNLIVGGNQRQTSNKKVKQNHSTVRSRLHEMKNWWDDDECDKTGDNTNPQLATRHSDRLRLKRGRAALDAPAGTGRRRRRRTVWLVSDRVRRDYKATIPTNMILFIIHVKHLLTFLFKWSKNKMFFSIF